MAAARSVLFAVILVIAAVMPAAVAAQEAVYEADTNHGLADDSAIETYDSEGVVTGDVHGLDMSVTVAENSDDAGLSGLLYRDTGRVFLRLDYDEEISRTIRLYLPREYVKPQLKQGLEAAESGVTADLEPTADRNHTVVTVTLEEPTTVVFPISAGRGAIADSRSGFSGIVANVTGIELPSLTDRGAEWHYVSADELNDSEADYIPANATTIQHDTSTNSEDADWVPVPSCDDGTQEICTYTKADQPDRTYILYTGADRSAVRYREGRSVSGDLSTAVNDAMRGVDNLVDDVVGLFGDGEDTSSDGGA